MDNFLQFFIKQKKFAFIFTLSMITVGLLALFNIQRDQFPQVDFEIMNVVTIYSGASPEDVEQNVTNPIEDELKNITGIDNFSSVSRENYSNITITLSQDVADIAALKQEVRNAVNKIRDLPEGVSELPTVIDIKNSLQSILKISIGSESLPYETLKSIIDSIINTVESIAGVSEVVQDNYFEREIRIIVDIDSLNKYKLSLPYVIEAIKKRNQRYTVGSNNDSVNEKTIVVLAEFDDAEAVGNVIVKSNFTGTVIRLRDIANIIDGIKEETAITRINSAKGFILKIRKQEKADVISTVDLIRQKVNEISAQYGDNLNIFYSQDHSKYVRNRLDIVTNNGIIGLVLVLIVLGLFLSFRVAFWVSIGLPVSLLGTLALLLAIGETVNLVSLAAMILVLGIVVDDSIIVAESICYHKQTSNDPYRASLLGFKRVILPVITTILTTILAFSSMFLMGGIMGKFIYVIPLVVIFALILSFLEVSLALPAHLASSSKIVKEKAWFVSIENIFNSLLNKILKLRYLVVIVFIVMLAATMNFFLNHMTFVLFPTAGVDLINAKLQMPVGTSLQRTDFIVGKIEKIISDVVADDLESTIVDIGNHLTHVAQFTISLIPSSNRERTAKDILKQLKSKTKDEVDNGELKFSIRRPGPPQGSDIEVRLLGNDNFQRIAVANSLVDILQNIEGVDNINRDDDVGKTRIEVNLDFEKMSRLNVDFFTVNRYLKAAFSGIDATSMRDGEDDISFRVYLEDEQNTENFLNVIKIINRNGYLVPLKQFVTIKEIEGEPNVNHFNAQRSILVSASVNDEVITSGQAVTKALKQLDLTGEYSGIKVISEGGAKETEQSLENFKKAFIVAIFAIFLLLVLLFNSYTQPILILLAIPFSFIGVVWAFFLHGEQFSFFSMLGMLALVGVIVNDSLVMVSHLNSIKEKSADKQPAYLWIARGSKDRLRAVVLTSLTTLAGVMPLAYGIGGVDFLLKPMALALGYGLLFGTFVTLILLPCLYFINFEIVKYFEGFVKRS